MEEVLESAESQRWTLSVHCVWDGKPLRLTLFALTDLDRDTSTAWSGLRLLHSWVFCIWGKLRSVSYILCEGSKWVIGAGKTTSFWYEKWMDKMPLPESSPHQSFSTSVKVCSIIYSGLWSVHDSLPQDIRSFILEGLNSLPLPDYIYENLKF